MLTVLFGLMIKNFDIMKIKETIKEIDKLLEQELRGL